MTAGAELGFGTTASWWNAGDMTDVDLNDGWVGGARVRLGQSHTLDVGVVGAVGPQSTFLAGPELKWEFARLARGDIAHSPAFHAAWINGLAIGASDDYDPSGDEPERDIFLAPYTGVLGSGGIRSAQMFVGFRFAASERFFNQENDLTLYPILAFGFLLHPSPSWSFFVEADLAGGLTVTDFGDSALIVYPSAGFSFNFDVPR